MSNKNNLLDLDSQICHRLYSLSNLLTRRYRPHLEKLGLTYPQYLVMLALWEEEGVSVQDLARRVKMDMGSISLILRKMQDKNLLQIKASKNDGRKKILQLTRKGRSLKAKASSVPEAMGCYINSVTLSEVDQLRNLLDKFYSDFSSSDS